MELAMLEAEAPSVDVDVVVAAVSPFRTRVTSAVSTPVLWSLTICNNVTPHTRNGQQVLCNQQGSRTVALALT